MLAGLKPVRMGNVLFVTSEERADKLRADGEVVPAAPPAERPVPAMVPAPPGAAPAPPLPAPPAVPPPAPRGGN